MKLRKGTLVSLVAVTLVVAVGAYFAMRPPADDPCAEPADLPVPRARIVACAERYVRDQWYTPRWGKFGALDADPHGHGSWMELARSRRGTLGSELAQLCTHPKDRAGALGHVALFDPAKPDGECKVFAVTPLLDVSLRTRTCAAVRAEDACMSRADAVSAR